MESGPEKQILVRYEQKQGTVNKTARIAELIGDLIQIIQQAKIMY